MENALRKLRLDMDSLNTMLRQKNIFSLKDVRHAIVETNGSLSVVPSESKTVLNSYFSVKVHYVWK
ncbi:YetF domain-containing protein [Mesobacillus foraminis]|uniref:YetF domain-containing protein n=1 Tax=Mesobacillus foraminis TaxID=279826 RepID=UPI0039A391B1